MEGENSITGDNANRGEFPGVIELNVGGVYYTTSLSTLRRQENSLLSQSFASNTNDKLTTDTKGRYFLDRDGVLFRYILDYLRNQKLVLPENFHEKERLKQEAEYFKLPEMVKAVSNHHSGKVLLPPLSNHTVGNPSSPTKDTKDPGYIIVSYRGTFAFGRDGLADVKFRKMSRILVCGKVSLCREVFGDTLNESRDPDRGTSDRYTSRFFLKHTFLEQAFDMLNEVGFRLITCCGSGTNSAGELKPGMESEECKWNHYNEFIFTRN